MKYNYFLMCIYKEIATNVKTCADAPIIHRNHYIEGAVHALDVSL